MDSDANLPLKPEKPLETDCCGNGCVPCVFDIYESEVKIWEKECERILQGQEEPDEQGPLLLEEAYRKFEIASVDEDIPNVFIFRFKIPNSKTLGLAHGQHVIIRCIDEHGQPITRQYSPITIDSQGHFEILIKVYDYGKMSRSIRQWKVGTQVEMRGPFNGILYKRNSYERLYLICMGTGITPFVALISSILADEADEVRIRLIFGCSTANEILLKKHLNQWNGFWNFSVTFAINSTENSQNDLYGFEIYTGKISKDLLDGEIVAEGNYKVFVCGSSNFTQDISKILKEMSVPTENIVNF
ncbi:hypothetical protein LOTGIDRAFT_114551 [Lottia gigantea]|uniref:NADH-cytochrome b5 reductase n=1 Tax=Lottia gigantea TaxID=225164 RepID=V4ATX3_LOTGI|nr:hypothetical protein LOTGIDRAFT_114551 [Lottia gigantea]ESO98360.1 hypothetical protein LOTGIDRAFT_114551 [Lottia gigantea]